jgi:general secretion pathway protein G
MKNGIRNPGFTLIEMLVVLAIIATLLTLVAPRYFQTLDRSRETVLRHDLNVMRDAIDKYYSDTGVYPDTLEDLVQRRYLREVPVDPVTGSWETWLLLPPVDPEATGNIYDVRSGSPEVAEDGSYYADW